MKLVYDEKKIETAYFIDEKYKRFNSNDNDASLLKRKKCVYEENEIKSKEN